MNTYNVTGTMPLHGNSANVTVYVAMTVQAKTFDDAMVAAIAKEPKMTITNVVQVGVANA